MFSALAGLQFVTIAEANIMPPLPQLPSIYIGSDGSVHPPAPIQRDGEVYTFTSNIFNHTLEVQRDNIVIDGAGYALRGNGIGKGIDLKNRKKVTIRNLELEHFRTCINIINSSRITVTENSIANSGHAIMLYSSTYNNIEGNDIANNGWGLLFSESASNNIVTANNITQSGNSGIWVEGTVPSTSDFNKIIGNNITGNARWGVLLRSSYGNTVVDNNIAYNECGIQLQGDNSQKCRIDGNNVANNEEGIRILTQYTSEFYHNNFINNTLQIYFGSTKKRTQTWDDGYPSGGNYWSDYTGTDADGDGIGDTPYIIDENNQDNHPLMNPVEITELPEFPSWTIIPILLTATLNETN